MVRNQVSIATHSWRAAKGSMRGRYASQSHVGHDRKPGVLSRQPALLYGSPTGNAGNPRRSGFLAMNRNRTSLVVGRWFGVFLVTLALASAASASSKEKALYSFQGGTDGAVPAGGIVFDKQGNLYGATQQGGGSNCSPMAACGTVYQLVPPAKQGDPWTENLLHVFQGKRLNDGEFPSGGVIADGLGNIYGTSAYGGTGDCVLLGIKGGCGTVFELSPPKTKGGQWSYAILYSFKDSRDGYVPWGDLVFDGAGNLYGATYFGGGEGTTCDAAYQYCGTVFKLSPPKTKGGKWAKKLLHSFAGGTDGANPNGGLVLDGKGVVYGTTFAGGNQGCKTSSSIGCGMVYALSPPAIEVGVWTEKTVHRFTGGNDGAQPGGGVIIDAQGSLYGGAEGGPKAGGIIFRSAPVGGDHWKETVLYAFTVAPQGGYDPTVARFDKNGNIYGTTNVGPGESLAGSVFRLKPSGRSGGTWTISILHGFTNKPDGAFPNVPLISDKFGNLYGSTQTGGKGQSCQGGCGTVFEVSP